MVAQVTGTAIEIIEVEAIGIDCSEWRVLGEKGNGCGACVMREVMVETMENLRWRFLGYLVVSDVAASRLEMNG